SCTSSRHRIFTWTIPLLAAIRARRRARRSGLAGGRVAVAGPREGMGGVGELPEQARHDEGDLLADVDRVVADALQGARHEHHVHGPLAPGRVVSDLDRHAADLAVE